MIESQKPSDREVLRLIGEIPLSDSARAVQLYLKLAEGRLKTGNYDVTVEACTQAIALDATNPIAYFLRSRAYIRLSRYDESLEDILSDLNLRPRHPESLRQHGDILHLLGRLEEALTAYNQCLRVDPRNLEGLIGRAFVHTTRRNFESALADLYLATDEGNLIYQSPEQCIALQNGYEPAYLLLQIAKSEMEVGLFEKALVRCNKAIKIERDSGEAFWLRAMVHLQIGNYEDALSDALIDLNLRPQNSETHRIHGDVLSWMEQCDAAVVAYTKSLERDPSNQNALDGRGNCYYNMERWSESLNDLQKLVDLGWNYDELLQTIEELQQLTGSGDETGQGNGDTSAL